MSISGGDALILKYPSQALESWQVNVFPKRVIATATIDGTPAANTYPFGELTVDGTSGWSLIREGMLIEISRDGEVYYTATARKDYDASAPTTLYIPWTSYGESGRGRETALAFEDGDDVTVYDVRVPWEFRSRLDPETKLPFKMGDQTVYYEDAPSISRTEYPQPVVNIGAWRRGVVDPDTGVATLTHSAAASTVWRGSDFTVLWSLPTGAALVSGYNLTDETIEVEYDAGVYIIGCTVTEVGGSTPARTRTGYRYVWAIDGDTQKDTSDRVAILPSDDVSDYDNGRNLTLTFEGTNLSDILYTGAPVLMTTRYAYSNDRWETRENLDGVTVSSYVGYVSKFTTVFDDGDIQRVVATVVNPLQSCAKLGVADYALRIKPVGNRWFKSIVAGGRMGHVGYFVYWIIQHHAPFFLTLHDYDWGDFDDFRAKAFVINSASIGDAIRNAAGYCLGGTAACTSDGTLKLKREPAYESDAYIAALDNRWTIDVEHIDGQIEYQRDELPDVYQAEGAFAVSANTGVIEIQVGFKNLYAPGQGTQKASIPDHIALSAADGAARTGHYLQALNAPTPSLELLLSGMQDVIDPAEPVIYTLDLSNYDAMNTPLLASTLFTVQRVTRDWTDNGVGWDVRTRLTVKPLTRGKPSLLQALPGVGGGGNGQASIFVYPALNLFETATSGAGAYIGDADWGWEFNFRTSAMGFTGTSDWVSGQGHRSGLFLSNPTIKRRYLDIELSTGFGTLTDVRRYELEYTASRGDNYRQIYAYTYITTPAPPELEQNPINGTETLYFNTPSGSAGDGLDLSCIIGENIGGGATDPGGEITFHKLTAYGVGTKPTGWTSGSSVTPATGGWVSGDVSLPNGRKRRLIDIRQYTAQPFPSVKRIFVEFNLTLGTVVNSEAYCLRIRHALADGSFVALKLLTFAEAAGTYEGTGVIFEYVGTLKLQGLQISLSSCLVESGDLPDGACEITNIYYEALT